MLHMSMHSKDCPLHMSTRFVCSPRLEARGSCKAIDGHVLSNIKQLLNCETTFQDRTSTVATFADSDDLHDAEPADVSCCQTGCKCSDMHDCALHQFQELWQASSKCSSMHGRCPPVSRSVIRADCQQVTRPCSLLCRLMCSTPT